MDNELTKILEKIHTSLGWIAIWLFLLVWGVGIGYLARIDGIRYLTNVGKISPLSASLSLVRSTFIRIWVNVSNKGHVHTIYSK